MNDTQTILLVEDDEVDVMTVKRSLKELAVKNPLKRAANGEEALAYLRDSKNQKPGIILLDINMPRMNGIEFLKIVKEDESLRKIPVIVLTTSREDKDRFETFDKSAAGYMIKPVDYTQFLETMKAIKMYWSTSELPEK